MHYESEVANQADGHAIVAHGATRDRLDYARPKPTTLDYLRHASKKSGRRPMQMVREFLRLSRGPGRITLPEYVQYGLYDTTRYGPDEQSQFISNTLHWPITEVCCDMTWQAATEDKWLCSRILEGSGITVPETLAVIDKTARCYPGTRKISTASQLREFVESESTVPLFGKENRGICSFGAFVVQEADGDFVRLKGGERFSFGRFVDEFIGETSYLLQRLETNHRFFEQYTSNLATVRLCVLCDEANVRFPFAVLKIPSSQNVADSFWRAGNLACGLDPRTGKIVGARSQNPFGTTDHTVHPETGRTLLGEIVPLWDRVLDLAQSCAPIFHSLRYQSMDIAITERGPVLIEINTGGGFDLPQLASGKGFLTAEVREFFRTCGYRRL